MSSTSDHPLKIAFCLPDQEWLDQMASGDPKDAAQIQQMYIANHLRARGHALTFLAPKDTHQMVYATDLANLRIARRTWTSSRWFDLTSRIVWKIQQWLHVPYLNFFSNYRWYDAARQYLPGFDLVFERNGIFNVGIAMACKKLKLPFVLFFDADQIAELDFMGKPVKGWLRRCAIQMLRYNLNAASCIVCVSEQSKRHLISDWDVSPEKIEVLPNGVDVQLFKPDPGMRAETRACLLLDNQPLVVFVGSFYEWHDVPTLLEAFAKVIVSRPDAHLILVGDGIQRDKMMQQAASLGIEQAAHFVGRVSHVEVPAFMNAADVAVVPVPAMLHDFWLSPMKLFEYMATGKPVVASGMGQIARVIRDDENGFLVQPGDTAMLAYALLKLIEDASLRDRLGQQARKDAVRDYSWENYILTLESVFSAILNPHVVRQRNLA